MSNVIDFTEEYVKRNKANDNQKLLRDTLKDDEWDPFSLTFAFAVAGDVINVMELMGFDIEDNPETVYDLILLLESIRALIHRSANKEYPLHDLSSNAFDVENPKEVLQNILDEMDQELELE